MNFNPFTLSRLPTILYGPGRFDELPALLAGYRARVLVITGRQSFRASKRWEWLVNELGRLDISWENLSVSGEPSPELVDDAVARFQRHQPGVVVAIGGGSVLDAAKAVAGLLPHGNSVMDHLEGVGKGLPYHGPALPFIAVPTTAGTGSEATKNAVLSQIGEGGFKKSFRHDSLTPDYALVDPELLASCPPPLIAADGMDAFTQLLESYVSSRANPLSDALAWSGLEAFNEGFFSAWKGEEPDASHGRAAMAYAALISGITLAQVGLGSVHGLASPLGAFFPIPHGVACGTLVGAATQINIEAMERRHPDHPALAKYARVGRLLTGQPHADERSARQALVEQLKQWSETLALPPLGEFGIKEADIPRIVANISSASMGTNPIVLTEEEVSAIVHQRL